MTAVALLDSNVVIAALAQSHEHHEPSFDLLNRGAPGTFAVAAHSYAEAYSTLTRRGERAPFGFPPEEAWAALESVRAVTVLVGLTHAQTFDAIRAYAAGLGVGARLNDKLIGQAAIVHQIPAIVSWNTGHMRGLFPGLAVVAPPAFDETYRPAKPG